MILLQFETAAAGCQHPKGVLYCTLCGDREDFGSSELIAQEISSSVSDLSFETFLHDPAGCSCHGGYKGIANRTT